MAFLLLADGRKVTMSAEKAALLWKIRQGEIDATKEQLAKAKEVAKFYFATDTAPESWKRLKSQQPIKDVNEWWNKV